MESSPTMDKVRTHKIYTNPVGGWRTTPQAHDAPIWRKSNPVGADSISARCKKSDFNNAAGASPRPTGGKVQGSNSGRENPSPTKIGFTPKTGG